MRDTKAQRAVTYQPRAERRGAAAERRPGCRFFRRSTSPERAPQSGGGTKRPLQVALIQSLLLSASLLAVGCGATQPPPTTAETVNNSKQVAENTKNPDPDFEPPLTVATWPEIQAKIAEQHGKIVAVDLWSTTCEPCLRELPGLVTLQQQFPDNVVCMSVNLDYIGAAQETPESHRDKVTRVLQTRKMDFPNFISATSDFDVYDAIKLASIPAVLVYDLTKGEASAPSNLAPVKRFDNDLNQYGDEGFSYEEHITPFVQQLLTK